MVTAADSRNRIQVLREREREGDACMDVDTHLTLIFWSLWSNECAPLSFCSVMPWSVFLCYPSNNCVCVCVEVRSGPEGRVVLETATQKLRIRCVGMCRQKPTVALGMEEGSVQVNTLTHTFVSALLPHSSLFLRSLPPEGFICRSGKCKVLWVKIQLTLLEDVTSFPSVMRSDANSCSAYVSILDRSVLHTHFSRTFHWQSLTN